MEELLKQKVFETLADVFGALFFISSRPLDDLPPRKSRNIIDSYIEVRIDIFRGNRFPAYFFFPEELALIYETEFGDLWMDFSNIEKFC